MSRLNTMAHIPVKPEDITKEWLEKILGDESSPVSVKSFQVSEGSGKGENFAAQVIRIEVEGEKGGKEYKPSLIAKVMPYMEWQRKIVKSMNMFDREVLAYNNVFPDMIKAWVGEEEDQHAMPRCFMAEMEGLNGIIVLEDLKPENYVLMNVREGLDFNHCKLTMAAIAKFHAIGYYLKYSGKKPLKEMYPDIDKPIIELGRAFFEPMFQKFSVNAINIMSKEAGEDGQNPLKASAKEIMDKFFRSLQPVEPFATICHGDLWNNNMLFKHNKETGEPVAVKFLDYQLVQYGCPTMDLCYFFCTSTLADLRNNHLKELLQYYHGSLMRNLSLLGVTEIGIGEFPFEELWKLYYGHSACLGMMQCAGLLPAALVEKDEAFDMKDESMTDLQENKKKFEAMAMEAAINNPNIHGRIVDVLNEMIENGAI